MLQSSYTQAELTEWLAQRAALRRVHANGLTRVTYGDRTVQYASVSDVAAALKLLDRRIAEAEVALGLVQPRRTLRTVRFIAGKGL